MGLEILLPLLIPILSPILTEAVKKLAELVVNHVPKAAVPHLSAAMGVLLNELAKAGGLDLFPGVTSHQMEDVLAAGLGYGGTGLNQASKLSGLSDGLKQVKKAVKFSLVLLASIGLLSGCAWFQGKVDAIKDNPTMQKACPALPLVRACADSMADKLAPTDPKTAGDLKAAVQIIQVIEATGCTAK